MEKHLTTTGAEQTKQLGEKLARQFQGGEVVELISDLGGGKTTLVHGLAKGIKSLDRVASPTFTISRLYKGKKLELHHFDFYRLSDAGLMEHEIHDVIGDPATVVVVEWGDIVAHVLPERRLTIRLTRTGDEERNLTLRYPKTLAYLVKEVS